MSVRPRAKLAMYANWRRGTTDFVIDDTVELEFYDYSTPGGAAEVDNTPDDPRAARLFELLVGDLIPNELRAPLPAPLRGPQAETHRHLIEYLDFLDHISAGSWLAGAGVTVLGYGLNVP